MVNNCLSISLAANTYGQVSIELCDISGRENYQIFNGFVADGINNLVLALPSPVSEGIHFLIIKQNGTTTTKPFMVIR